MTSEELQVSAIRDQTWADLRDLRERISVYGDHPELAPEWLVAKVMSAVAGELYWRAAQAASEAKA